MLKSCIYIIRCSKTIKVYIGSAFNFEKRFACHLSLLRSDKHQAKLQNAFNKHGESSFTFNILEIVEDKTKLIEREQYYLDTLLFASEKDNRFDELSYNICRIANSREGILHREESKLKMSRNKKKHLTAEHKRNISIGINNSEKYKNSITTRGINISKSLQGHYVSEETKRKNSEWHKDRHPSDETKKKTSDSMKIAIQKEERFQCEHCQHVVRKCTYVTYHGNKCKYKLAA